MLLVRTVITVLCAIGIYASVFMLSKSARAAKGELREPSVVQTPRAALFFGVPNAFFGVLYYAALAVVTWSARNTALLALALAATVLAAATSAYLAYSLLFVTKRSCPYCWSAHAVNWALVAAILYLLALR
ncbi:MAG TPA: vitamin K epoxide reductase family protein [Candidatus Baltobacteraceae bacterium]|nr:vitamin K epoxide reductase family protein [Candidatus Baltobacteraceae bacterium]